MINVLRHLFWTCRLSSRSTQVEMSLIQYVESDWAVLKNPKLYLWHLNRRQQERSRQTSSNLSKSLQACSTDDISESAARVQVSAGMRVALHVSEQVDFKRRALFLYQSIRQYYQNSHCDVTEDIDACDAEDCVICRCIDSSGSCDVVLRVHAVNAKHRHEEYLWLWIDCSSLWLR